MEKQLIENLEEIKKKYQDLDQKIIKETKNNNFEIIKEYAKEQKKYQFTYQLYIKYLDLKEEIKDSESILELEDDKKLINELKKLISNNKKEINILEEKLLDSLIEKDPIDKYNAFIEIKGAAGGLEANIFANDLLDMYLKYAQKIGFKAKIIDLQESEKKGISYVNFKIMGEGAYGRFKYESGVHRVQRIPETESNGRIHTSTATVSVTPELDDLDLKINKSDLRIDTYRSSGAGGQHVNKTDSAVRILHIPTGIISSSQSGRSQHDNKERAMQSLRSKIYQQKLDAEQQNLNKTKKEAVGTGDRAEKIRTYNYQQNRVTDHRINLTLKKLDIIMSGDLEEFLNLLHSSFKDKNN
ncbi:Peptide chain release factor 1 [Candidatus Hepatoplasma crinochetorum Av]|uniref:Peptide chain release factor 1 n=1 Tax=Candidatus Hepatoplasma crinochetorum Av TaxID=1427984 RepID=W8GJ12_9MOLU|nr:peptide chain release factor 1 [Candidatus Hepatoplasma crinochetorum]AHK22232.1 Peptide chain release factor 1 [Candidatus Hepatoplasma crinochetorum Av]